MKEQTVQKSVGKKKLLKQKKSTQTRSSNVKVYMTETLGQIY